MTGSSDEPLRYRDERDLPRFVETSLRGRFGDQVEHLPSWDSRLLYRIHARTQDRQEIDPDVKLGEAARWVPGQPERWFEISKLVADELALEIWRKLPPPSMRAQLLAAMLITKGDDDADKRMYDMHTRDVLALIDEFLSLSFEREA